VVISILLREAESAMQVIFTTSAEPRLISSVPTNNDVEQVKKMLREYPCEGTTVYGRSSNETNETNDETDETDETNGIDWMRKQCLAIAASEVAQLNGITSENTSSEEHENGTNASSTTRRRIALPMWAMDITRQSMNRFGGVIVEGAAGAKKYAATTMMILYETIVKMLREKDPRGPCFYELIREVPTKLYFDLEAELELVRSFSGDMMDTTIRTDLREFLVNRISTRLCSDTSAIPILRVDASTKRKWSSHYIVPLCFENSYQVGAVAREFMRAMITKYGAPNDSRRNPYFLQKIDKCIDGYTYKPLVDMGVYTSNRVFRGCGCSKAGDPSRIFIYCNAKDKQDTIFARKARGFIPSFKQFVDCKVQDELFSALWKEHYGSYIRVTKKDGSEFFSAGVRRLTLFDDNEQTGGNSFYQAVRSRSSRDSSGSSTSSSSSSSSSSGTTQSRGDQQQASSSEAAASPETTPFYHPIHKRKSVWVDQISSKRRKLTCGNYKEGTAPTSTFYTEDITIAPSSAGGVTLSSEAQSSFSAKTTDTVMETIRSLARVSPNYHTCFVEHGIMTVTCNDTYCNQKRAHHRDNRNTFVLLNPFGMTMSQQCWKATCRSDVGTSESKVWPTWFLRTALPKRSAEIVAAIRCTMAVMTEKHRTEKSDENETVEEDCSLLRTTDVMHMAGAIMAPDSSERTQALRNEMKDMYRLIYDSDDRFTRRHRLQRSDLYLEEEDKDAHRTRRFEGRFARRLLQLDVAMRDWRMDDDVDKDSEAEGDDS